MIIGINPGGNPTEIKSSIQESFEAIKDPEFNAYFETWTKNGQRSRLQKNLQNLFNCYLKTDLKTVCATNLFWERTIRETDLSFSHLPQYKKIMEKVLDIVQPNAIIVFGKRPFKEIMSFMDPGAKISPIESGHGNWKINLANSIYKKTDLKIVGLPHLSRYTLYEKQMKQIDEFIN